MESSKLLLSPPCCVGVNQPIVLVSIPLTLITVMHANMLLTSSGRMRAVSEFRWNAIAGP